MLDPDLDMLETTFRSVFKVSPPQEFGRGHARQRFGFCDGTQGVQWSTWINYQEGRTRLGVNLEGMKYIDWPIATLILRELEEPMVFEAIKELKNPAAISLRFTRDAWQASARLNIRELHLGKSPLPLNKLSADLWGAMLSGALDCLDSHRGYRGRNRVEVTLNSTGQVVEKWVSPHLNFNIVLWGKKAPTRKSEVRKILTTARAELSPLYDFVLQRSS